MSRTTAPSACRLFTQLLRAEFERSQSASAHLQYRRLYRATPRNHQLLSTTTSLKPAQRPNHGSTSAYPNHIATGQRLEPIRQHRRFSASTSQAAAVVTSNPRKDEEGNAMLIDITERASKRLKEIMAKESNPSLALRVTVESGGCHGFQYLMSLTNTSAVAPEEDTVFEAGDGSGAKVVMDEPSLELLKGSKVDFTMELIGSQFKIVGNPAATSSCGCGTSFDIKP